MNTNYTEVDMEKWDRKDEFNFFQSGGCGFTLCTDIDITNLYDFAHKKGIKLYPLLVSCMIKVINLHKEFKYGWSNDGKLINFEVVHPLIFDLNKSGNTKCLCAEYKDDILEQVKEIETVREEYKEIEGFRPQAQVPQNCINISCAPWVKTTSISFVTKYCDDYFPPIVTFGKYEKKDGSVIIPLSVYCNHCVNDGYHCSRLFLEFQQTVNEL